MRVPLGWLREFCPTELDLEELSDLLSLKGLHVEAVERPWEGLHGVVVAQVLDVRDHPRRSSVSPASTAARASRRSSSACATCRRAISCPTRPRGRASRCCPTRPGADDPRRRLQRDALLAARARDLAGARERDPAAARDDGRGRGPEGSARPRRRRLRPRDRVEPTGPALDRRGRPRGGGRHRRPAVDARHVGRRGDEPASSAATWRSRTPTGVLATWRGRSPTRARADADPGAGAPHRVRDPPDLPDRRRHELRDARLGQPLHAFDLRRLAGPGIVVGAPSRASRW